MVFFVANPYALIKGDVCTHVVAMQDFNENQIKEILSKYEYDEAIPFSEHGREIMVGYVRHEDRKDRFVIKRPYKSWIYNFDVDLWLPPIPPPEQDLNGTSFLYIWNEEDQAWVKCDTCPEESPEHFH